MKIQRIARVRGLWVCLALVSNFWALSAGAALLNGDHGLNPIVGADGPPKANGPATSLPGTGGSTAGKEKAAALAKIRDMLRTMDDTTFRGFFRALTENRLEDAPSIEKLVKAMPQLSTDPEEDREARAKIQNVLKTNLAKLGPDPDRELELAALEAGEQRLGIVAPKDPARREAWDRERRAQSDTELHEKLSEVLEKMDREDKDKNPQYTDERLEKLKDLLEKKRMRDELDNLMGHGPGASEGGAPLAYQPHGGGGYGGDTSPSSSPSAAAEGSRRPMPFFDSSAPERRGPSSDNTSSKKRASLKDDPEPEKKPTVADDSSRKRKPAVKTPAAKPYQGPVDPMARLGGLSSLPMAPRMGPIRGRGGVGFTGTPNGNTGMSVVGMNSGSGGNSSDLWSAVGTGQSFALPFEGPGGLRANRAKVLAIGGGGSAMGDEDDAGPAAVSENVAPTTTLSMAALPGGAVKPTSPGPLGGSLPDLRGTLNSAARQALGGT